MKLGVRFKKNGKITLKIAKIINIIKKVSDIR
jgi:hypothetical protein